MSMQITRYDLINYVWDALEGETDEVLRTYSGRGMYGKECLGIVVSDLPELIRFIKFIATDVSDGVASEAVQEFYDNIENVSTDSMGLGTIFYWQQVELVGENEED